MLKERKNQLVVLFHGYRGSPETFSDIIDLASETYPDAIIHAPLLPYSNGLAKARAAAIAADQIKAITDLDDLHGFETIVLIGHSTGAALARRVYVEASHLPKTWPQPEEQSATEPSLCVEPELAGVEPQGWFAQVSHLVLIAGMGRGWSLDNAKSGLQQFYWGLGSVIGHAMPGTKPTVFDIRLGAPFIVQTRLRWLRLMLEFPEPGTKPKVVQLLGTVDEVVAPNDSIDFAADPEGKQIQLIEIPETGHDDIVSLTPSKTDAESEIICKRRRTIIQAALLDDEEVLKPYAIPRGYMTDELPPLPKGEIRDVVFIIHGIRDTGYWTKRIAARIKAKAAEREGEFVARTPSYGYFPILPFLLPWFRRQKVEWLMDQYVEAKAHYPNAEFHYMGHSNGTYLGARALLDYPAVSFRRIMFAGSVVRPDYPWEMLVRGGRVEKIYNAVASKDYVVALFPNGLRWLKKFFDLGGAGHRGFETTALPNALFQLEYQDGKSKTRKYVDGAHSAAKQESQWEEIAEFIVNGKNPPADTKDFVDSQPAWSRWLGRFAPAGVFGLATVLLCLFLFMVLPLFSALVPDAGITADVAEAIGFSEEFLPARVVEFWNWWMGISVLDHLTWLAIYLVTLRFIALKF